MAQITLEKQVRASVQRVFAVATNLRDAPRNIPAIKSLEVLTDGPVRLGTRFRETRVMFGREATEEMEVTAFDPPRSVSIGCESHGCRYRTDFRFEPRDGGTHVEMTFAAEPLSVPAKVMSFLMRPMMKKIMAECGKDLDAVAAAAERG
jgi:hypothetical protein